MNKNILPICKKVIEDYIFAFNKRDYEGMANLFNFPHIRFANDNVSIISKDEYLSSSCSFGFWINEKIHKNLEYVVTNIHFRK